MNTSKVLGTMRNRNHTSILWSLLAGLFFVPFFAPVTAQAQSFPPVNLGAVINSEYAEVNPVLSITGDTLYFGRMNHPENRYKYDSQDIWMSTKKKDGGWTDPVRLPNSINITQYNSMHGVLADGKTFLISGIFDEPGEYWLRKGFSLIKRNNDSTWGKPVRIKMPWYSWKNEGDLATAMITPDARYIFMSFSNRWAGKRLRMYVSEIKDTLQLKKYFQQDSIRQLDSVFVSANSGAKVVKKNKVEPIILEYTKPRQLKGPFQDFYHAESPFLSEYDGRLYFSGRRTETDKDPAKLYSVMPVDSKKDMIHWKDLHPISDTVNSQLWDSYFSPHKAGTYAYFCSHRETYGKSDIYKVMLVEERPWIKVTGYLVNAKTGELMPKDKEIEVRINGASSDSVVMNESTFFALLPLGQRYEFTANLQNYTSDTAVVDVTGSKLYSEHEIRITFRTLPYVNVSGILTNSLSQTAIPAKNKPVLLIDGKQCDSLKFDPANSSYSVNLPYGRKYNLAVQATDYTSIPTELDLTQHNEYTKLSQNVPAKPKLDNLVTLRGRMINTKTGQPLDPSITAKMRVNKQISDAFVYNPADATYTLKLLPGADYDLVPSVQNFYNKLEVVDLRNAKPRDVINRDFFVTPLEIGQSVDIENIFFETGKSKLKEESFRSLNALVEFFQEYPNVKVEIGGHTDNVGSATTNKRLSQERAKSVALYIIGQGISKDRFQAKGYGPDKPKATNKTKEGRARNRRVDFTIIGI